MRGNGIKKKGWYGLIIVVAMALMLLAGSAGAVPVEEWNRTYPDLVWGIGDLAQTGDGGYIIAATDLMAKIDAFGNKQWIRKLNKHETVSHESLYVSQVDQTRDGGYIFGGYKSFVGDFGSKQISLVIKTDAEGIEQWNRTFDENIEEFRDLSGEVNSIQQTNDGGYILAESTIRDNTNDACIIKLNSGGNIEWTRTFTNSLKPTVRETPDGSYIVSLSMGTYGDRFPETSLKNLDAKGNDLWNTTYRQMGNVHVELTEGGGYIIAGEMSSPRTNTDALLIKTDANGNELWNKTYGGTGDDGFRVIRKTLDRGYILAGYTGADYSSDVYNFYRGDAWLVKVDADGNKAWDMTFGELETKTINSVRQTYDGGYIFAGGSESKSWIVKLTNDSAEAENPQAQQKEYGLSQIWTKLYSEGEIYAMQQTDGGIVLAGMNFDGYKAVLIKTDSSGNEIWNHTFKGGSNERFYGTDFHAIDETKDGGFILGGIAVYDRYARYDPWLVKTDSSGKEEWNRTIGNENEDISAVLALDDGYILSSGTSLIRTDNKGNQLWIKKYNNSGIRDIKRAKDGGYIIIASEDGGWGYTGDVHPPTGWILRTDEYGNEMWKKSFGEYPRKMVTPNSVLQTGDGGYLVVGDYAGYDPSSHDTHSRDAWIIKFDSYGNEKWRRIIKIKSEPPPVSFNSFVDAFPSVVETKDGDYIIGGIINLYRTTGMDALIIKIDSNGTELWNMTAGGDGNQVVFSMQQTSDGGLIFAGSMRNLDTEGHFRAWLMKVGKKEETNASSNTIVGNMNGTSSVSPNTGLTAVQTSTENVPAEKAAGFEAVLAITILLAVYTAWRRRW